MRRKITNSRIVNTTEELLKASLDAIDAFRNNETGGNRSKFPTVVVFLGKKSSEFIEQVKQPLDDNWSNAIHLSYLKVYKSGEKWICEKLVEKEEDHYDWDGGSYEYEETLNDEIVQMLGKDENIFDNCNGVKIDFILDSTEEDGEEFYHLYKESEISIYNITKYKSLFLMIDQRPLNGADKVSDKLVQTIVHDDDRDKNVFLLSNVQKNARILLENKIWMNYRLVANLIILGGNRNESSGMNAALTAGVKTASYAIVTKPTKPIAEVVVYALFNQMLEQEKSKFKKVLSDEEIMARIDMRNDGTMAMAENMLADLMENSPQPSKSAINFFPFASDKGIQEVKKEKINSLKVLDGMTMGVAQCYVDQYYMKPVRQLFENEDRKKKIYKDIIEFFIARFSYTEMKNMLDRKQIIVEKLKRPIIQDIRKDGDITRIFASSAANNSKELFYEYFKELLADAFLRVLEYAEEWEEYYLQIKKEMDKIRNISGDKEPTIETYYTEVIRSYVEDKEKVGGSAFPKVFRITNTKEQILQEVYNEYIELLYSQPVFRYDFENEVQHRVDNMSPQDQQRFVREELISQIEGSIRLNNIINLSEQRLVNFYLINPNAKYAEYLRKDPGYETGSYQLYNLNRTDCIEQLEIYSIPNVDLVHLVPETENE